MVSVSSARMERKTLVQAVVSDELRGVTQGDSGSESLADRLRLGSLTEDGLSYKEKCIVRSYEVGINKTVTMQTDIW
ncbi:hypothetical protein SLEP1_g42381 [Rubroshorea leprosula]|uniref:Uncharacterized protein n=1 Tax=Rubroshorea leprosula TaxID=152421 RepID=A0AAV5L9W7_9ROSI|nr:hypothetical protein SLEP1_g42381 [Rubroshorea leprosula]